MEGFLTQSKKFLSSFFNETLIAITKKYLLYFYFETNRFCHRLDDDDEDRGIRLFHSNRGSVVGLYPNSPQGK